MRGRVDVLGRALLLRVLAPKLRAGVHDAVASDEHLVERALLLEIARVQRQPAGCVRAIGLEEAGLLLRWHTPRG